MAGMQLFAANYNRGVLWVYEELRHWLAARDVELILAQCATEDEVIETAQDADIYLAYKFKVPRNVIGALPKLKLLMASGSGYDHIDVPAATEHGVVVTCGASYNVDDVAEHAVTLIIACGRCLRFFDRVIRQGSWGERPDQPVHRFVGKTVGLIGFGNIARAVAWRARGLGFQVLAHDPYVGANEMAGRGVEAVGLEELLRRSDFVSLHLRLNEETRHLLGEEQLRWMKPTAYVINTSRGGVLDEEALIRALMEEWIAGAGLDVFEKEPPDLDNPLLAMENVIVTGHAAGSTLESTEDWHHEWRRIIEDFLGGRWPVNVVNPEVQPKVPLRERSSSQ